MLKTAAVLGVIVPSASRPFHPQAGSMVILDVTGCLVCLGERLALAADGQKLQKDLLTGEFGNPRPLDKCV